MRFFGILIGVAALAVFGIVLLRFLALKRPIQKDSPGLFIQNFELVAHRGGALEAPENTLEAFSNALRIDPNIIFEFDIHLSKDGEIVVFHDSTLERTTDGLGPLREKTLEELKRLDAAYFFKNPAGEFSFRGKGVRIPTLREVFKAFPKTRFVIEYKTEEPGVENKLISLIEEFGYENNIIIASQKTDVLIRTRNLRPHWQYSGTEDEILRAVMLQAIYLEPLTKILSNAFLIPEREGSIQVLTPRLLTELHRRGKKILIWTVNDEADMRRLIAQGVDGIITDHPSLLYKVIKGL
jgi:glycerophosphoryl diester phosphodiesterase